MKTCNYSLYAGKGRTMKCEKGAKYLIDNKPLCSKHAEIEKPFSEKKGVMN